MRDALVGVGAVAPICSIGTAERLQWADLYMAS